MSTEGLGRARLLHLWGGQPVRGYAGARIPTSGTAVTQAVTAALSSQGARATQYGDSTPYGDSTLAHCSPCVAVLPACPTLPTRSTTIPLGVVHAGARLELAFQDLCHHFGRRPIIQIRKAFGVEEYERHLSVLAQEVTASIAKCLGNVPCTL